MIELQDDKLHITVGPAKVKVSASATIAVEDASWHPDQGIDLATKKLTIPYGSAPCSGQFLLKKLN